MKFQQLANKLTDMPENELVFIFLEALPSKTLYEVLSNIYLDKTKQIDVFSEESCDVLISEVLDEPDIEEETSWEFAYKPNVIVQVRSRRIAKDGI
jgi:hypothetical protein